MLYIKLILFIISNLGWWEFIRKKIKVHEYFLPSLTIAIQVTFLFLSGLLNVLKETSYFFYLFGLIHFLYCVYKDKKLSFLKAYRKPGYYFLFFSLIFILFFLQGKLMGNYDNYTHWGIVVKTMLANNRFPNFKDNLILFKEYPLGSSVYIYYASKFIGEKHEFIYMFAQSFMLLSCLVPLFIFETNNNKIRKFVFLILVSIFFLTYNIKLTDLLVDTLLALVSSCALLYLYYYKNDKDKVFYTIPFYLVQLIQIKNSGLLFAVVIIACTIYFFKKDISYKKVFFTVFVPLLSFILWKKHCNYVFQDFYSSKHAITFYNFSTNFSKKTWNDIYNIFIAILKESFLNVDVLFVFMYILIIGVFLKKIMEEQYNIFKKIIYILIFIYCTYQIGLFFTYVFSMPTEEALLLASISRYMKTIFIFILYFLIIFSLKILSESRKMFFVLIVYFVIFQIISLGKIELIINGYEYPVKRIWFEKMKKEYNIEDNSTYCILTDKNDKEYSFFLGMYVFGTENIALRYVEDIKSLDTIKSKYILVYDDENEIIMKWIEKNYPNQIGNKVIVKEDN